MERETGTYKQVGENHKLDCEAMQYIMALRAKLHRRKRGALTLGDLKRLAKAIAVSQSMIPTHQPSQLTQSRLASKKTNPKRRLNGHASK